MATGTLGQHDPQSVDLWKFFEDRGSKLKDSLFATFTWIIGLASAVLGFGLKEGFAPGSALTAMTQPAFVFVLGIIGILILLYAEMTILDYGRHINSTVARANAARRGEVSPDNIWEASERIGYPKDDNRPGWWLHPVRRWRCYLRQELRLLPPFCRRLQVLVLLFFLLFAGLITMATMSWAKVWIRCTPMMGHS